MCCYYCQYGVMGSRQTSTFFSLLACMCTYYQYNQLTLTENKKKALFYITACWSKSWTVGHRVVHTQCLNFFYICLYIYNVCCVVCLCCVVRVLLNHFTLLHCFFSPHTFQIPANQNSHFCPICIFKHSYKPHNMHKKWYCGIVFIEFQLIIFTSNAYDNLTTYTRI